MPTQIPTLTGPTTLTADDRQLLRALHEEIDPTTFAEKLHDYYLDVDRADRTPRVWLYFHLMKLLGEKKGL